MTQLRLIVPGNGPKVVPIKPRPAPSFKWMRILCRRWQTNTPYNESTYLNAPALRASPLIRYLDRILSNVRAP
jgi:hypothetical protein